MSTTSNFVVPNTVTLHRAFPNPFNPFSKVPYTVDIGQNINISVYDIRGRQIDNLVNHYHAPGNYMTSFYGNNISSGIYFVTLKHKDGMQTQKIVYTK